MRLSLFVTALLLVMIGITINSALTRQEKRSRANSYQLSSLPVSVSSSAVTTTVDTGNVGQYNTIAIGADGLPIISYFEAGTTPGIGNLKVLKCGNAACSSGNIITTIDHSGRVGIENSSIAIDKAGMPIIVYVAVPENNFAISKIVRCGNLACSSGNTITDVNTPDHDLIYKLLIGNDGLPIIAYIHDYQYVKVIKCGNANCTSGNITGIADQNTTPPYSLSGDSMISFLLGADGLPVISYEYYIKSGLTTNYVIKAAKCGNPACTGGNTTNIVYSKIDTITPSVNPTPVFGNPHIYEGSMVLKNNGLPVLIFGDLSHESEKSIIINCGNTDCSQANTTNTISLSDTKGIDFYNSSGIAGDGLPVISYHAGYGVGLKVLKCGNSDCSENNISTVIDSKDYPGTYNHLVIAPDGLPVISYYEETSKTLKVAKCTTFSCAQSAIPSLTTNPVSPTTNPPPTGYCLGACATQPPTTVPETPTPTQAIPTSSIQLTTQPSREPSVNPSGSPSPGNENTQNLLQKLLELILQLLQLILNLLKGKLN